MYDSPAFLLLALLCLFQRNTYGVLFFTNGFYTPKTQKLLPPVMNQDNQDRNYGEDSNIFLNADLQRGGGKPCPKPNTEPFLPGQVTHVSQTEDRLSDCLPGGWKGPLFSTTSG